MDKGIIKEQYEALKENGLNFKEVASKYLTDAEIEVIGFQETLYLTPKEGGSFANFSSFAYWGDHQEKTIYEEAKKNVETLQNWGELNNKHVKLHADYVFLGVNAGAKGMGLKGIETFEHFEMFQIRSIKTENGFKGIPSPIKYKNALIKTGNEEFYLNNVQGTYMTDFIKGFPTDYGPSIMKVLKEVKEKLDYTDEQWNTFYNNFCKLFGDILETELSLLGGNTHTLIVMAKNPETSLLNKFIKESGLDKKYKIVNISHYSGSPSSETLTKELINAFSK